MHVSSFTEAEILAYLEACEAEVMAPGRRRHFAFTAAMREALPTAGGVYVFFHDTRVFYVGETTSLRQRLAVHMRNPENHVLALKVARLLYDRSNGQGAAKSTRKFPETHKEATRSWVEANLIVSFLQMGIGRKELEERLVDKHSPEFNERYPELP